MSGTTSEDEFMNKVQAAEYLDYTANQLRGQQRMKGSSFPQATRDKGTGMCYFKRAEIAAWKIKRDRLAAERLAKMAASQPPQMRYYHAEVHAAALDEYGGQTIRVRRLALRVPGGIDSAMQAAIKEARVQPDAVVGVAVRKIDAETFLQAPRQAA